MTAVISPNSFRGSAIDELINGVDVLPRALQQTDHVAALLPVMKRRPCDPIIPSSSVPPRRDRPSPQADGRRRSRLAHGRRPRRR